MTRLLLVFLFAATASPPLRPTAKFTVQCGPIQRLCQFNGTSSDSSATGGIVKYAWDFGDGRSQTDTTPIASHSFPSNGSYCVRLTVTDRSGLTSYATRALTIPLVAGAKVAACSSTPPVPPVVTPPPKPDTVTLTRHDTIAMLIALPTPLPTMTGIYVDSAQVGQPIRFYRVCLLGMGSGRPGGSVEVFPNNGFAAPPQQGIFVGVFQSTGVAPTLWRAAAMLDSTIAGCKP